MNVEELIAVLQEYPSDLRVVVNGYEDGYDDPSPAQANVARIAPDTGFQEWVGAHHDPIDAKHDADIVEAPMLRRTSN